MVPMAGHISMGARREFKRAVADRYRSGSRSEKGRILDQLCAVTGWHKIFFERVNSRMVRPERLFADGDRALEKRLGLG